jgi:halogenation protein CepH
LVALHREGDRVVGVRFRDSGGVERSVTAPYVVVASGNTGALAKGIGRRVLSDFFQNIALFGYYEGGRRLPAPNEGNILCAAFDEGWFWYIPLSSTLTSVGAVVARENIGTIQAGRAAAMDRFIASCPLIADCLATASRVTEGRYRDLRVRKDYSYCNSVFWEPGAVLVGDAACFVDPVFSTGVHLATYSGVLAARSINTRLAGELTEDACFREFESRYRREFSIFYQFLQSMYDINRDESSYFWSARKLVGSGDTDMEAFVDLVAGVSGPEWEPVQAAGSPAKRFGTALADAAAEDSRDQGGIVFSGAGVRLLGSALREASDLQARGALADTSESLVPAVALFPGGLIPSADGLRWRQPDGAGR